MTDTQSLMMTVTTLSLTALVCTVSGALGYRAWAARVAAQQRRIPERWQLRVRPLFTTIERTVWHWLKRVFFDHHVLVKTPVIRFLLPSNTTKGQRSDEPLKGVYCSFTICTSDGTVVGCVDVHGSSGLKASNRDLKKKLFEECGIAYAVLNADQLPTLEALRAAFLGDATLARPPGYEFAATSQMPFSQPGDIDVAAVPAPATAATSAVPHTSRHRHNGLVRPGGEPTHASLGADSPQAIDLIAVAAVRNSLQSKLDHNRKVRLAKIDELTTNTGTADDGINKNLALSWDDSFIMGEEPKKRKTDA